LTTSSGTSDGATRRAARRTRCGRSAMSPHRRSEARPGCCASIGAGRRGG
jgi:hypothetical protein